MESADECILPIYRLQCIGEPHCCLIYPDLIIVDISRKQDGQDQQTRLHALNGSWKNHLIWGDQFCQTHGLQCATSCHAVRYLYQSTNARPDDKELYS
eukprot:scaffold309243_cov30-Prasinocladus_malaysianus.AAC.2